MHALQKVENKFSDKKIPSFRSGDTVKVHVKIKEGDKERIQIFEGVVIKMHNCGLGSSFTVRKMSFGVGVERIFPIYSPVVSRIERVNEGKVRRAKLYYLREREGKKARIETLERGEGHGQPKPVSSSKSKEPTAKKSL